MMKKWTSLIAAIVIVFVLAGCSANTNSPQAPQDSSKQQSQQSVEPANKVSNESIPFTSLEELEEIYAVNWDYHYGGVDGMAVVSPNPELKKLVDVPVHITNEGFNSLSLEDRKLYAKILLRYLDINCKELGLLSDSDGIKFDSDDGKIPGYWIIMPDKHAGYLWPKDNHWGAIPFSPDTPKR